MSAPSLDPSAVAKPVDRRARRWGTRVSGVIVLATTLGLLSAIATSCKTQAVPTEAPALGASLELASGEVILRRRGRRDDSVFEHAAAARGPLHTGVGARALVRLSDGTRVFLRDQTTVTLVEGLSLESGQAWIEAPPLERSAQSLANPHARRCLGLGQ